MALWFALRRKAERMQAVLPAEGEKGELVRVLFYLFFLELSYWKALLWYEGCGKCWYSKGSLEPLLPALLTIKKKIEPPESGKVSSFNRMAISSLPNKSEGSKRTGSYPAPMCHPNAGPCWPPYCLSSGSITDHSNRSNNWNATNVSQLN